MLFAVLVITLSTNYAYAESDNVKKAGDLVVEIEKLLERSYNLDIQLEDNPILQERYDHVQEKIDKKFKQFIYLTTTENGVNDEMIQQVKEYVNNLNGEQRAIGNYATDFFTSPVCSHDATFVNNCYGSDYQTSEFSFTTPTNTYNVNNCSYGPCVSVAWQLNAPTEYYHTPEILHFDKKYNYGVDFVTGAVTNPIWLYSADTTHYWNNTPVGHNMMAWTVHYYESSDGQNKKTIWFPSSLSVGFGGY